MLMTDSLDTNMVWICISVLYIIIKLLSTIITASIKLLELMDEFHHNLAKIVGICNFFI